MSTKTRWAVIAAGVVCLFVALFWLNPEPVTPRPEEVVADAVPRVAPELQRTAVSPPATAEAPAPSEAIARYSNLEDFPRGLFERTLTIRGRVTDRLGTPVARAQVYAREVDHAASTDVNGTYELTHLEPGSYDVIGVHEDYSDSAPVTVWAGSSDANLLLPPLGTLEGRVIAARDGTPVTDFRIRPEPLASSPDLVERKQTRFRDERGRFRLERVKAGTSAVSVGAKGFSDTVIRFPALAAGEARQGLELRLDAGAELRGRVVDERGQGVGFARISGGTPRRGAICDAEGNFALDSLPAGTFELTVKHDDYARKVAQVSVARGIINRTRIVLRAGAVVEGEITWGGTGVPGEVSIDAGDESILSAQSTEDGHYRIGGVPDGRLRVECVVRSGETWHKSVSIDVVDGVAPRVDFNYPAGRAWLQGTVFTAPGTPYRGRGELIATYQDFTLEGPTLGTIRYQIVLDGAYQLQLPSGDISVTIFLLGSQEYERSSQLTFGLTLRDGEQLRHDTFLYGGATLRIALSEGGARAGTSVLVVGGVVPTHDVTESFLKSLSVVGQAPVDPRGTATVRGLGPGTYTILVIAPATPEETAASVGTRLRLVGGNPSVSRRIKSSMC